MSLFKSEVPEKRKDIDDELKARGIAERPFIIGNIRENSDLDVYIVRIWRKISRPECVELPLVGNIKNELACRELVANLGNVGMEKIWEQRFDFRQETGLTRTSLVFYLKKIPALRH